MYLPRESLIALFIDSGSPIFFLFLKYLKFSNLKFFKISWSENAFIDIDRRIVSGENHEKFLDIFRPISHDCTNKQLLIYRGKIYYFFL